jgi:hypothetical protein
LYDDELIVAIGTGSEETKDVEMHELETDNMILSLLQNFGKSVSKNHRLPWLYLDEKAADEFNDSNDETEETKSHERDMWGPAVDALRSMSVFMDIGSSVVKPQGISKQEVHICY